jgi:hypothetical protein
MKKENVRDTPTFSFLRFKTIPIAIKSIAQWLKFIGE